jgi:hypothetical protein
LSPVPQIASFAYLGDNAAHHGRRSRSAQSNGGDRAGPRGVFAAETLGDLRGYRERRATRP